MRELPLIEGILVGIHIFGFFGVIVTLWVMSPTGDPKTVFVKTFFLFYFSSGHNDGFMIMLAFIGLTTTIIDHFQQRWRME